MGCTSTQLANLLQSCIDAKAHRAGKLLHAHLLRFGLSRDTFLSNRLIDFYSKCCALSSACHVFDEMPQRDVFTWNTMLCAYSRAGELGNAHALFAEMPEKNTVSWNTLITALVRHGSEEGALGIYCRMIRGGHVPTRFTLASVLSACGAVMDLDCGRECHGLAVKIGLDRNLYVSNALLCMYAKCMSMKDAVQAFGDVSQPNEVSFTAIMGGLVECDRVEEAVEVFRLMHRSGVIIDSVSLSSILAVVARGRGGDFGVSDRNEEVGHDVPGQQVHGLAIKLGFETDRHFSNSLLDIHTKNGDMDKAELVFANMQETSVVSFNVMIAGYGQKNLIEKALYYFQRMHWEGLEPDEVTYINMLAACVRSGDIEGGHKIFDRMDCPSLTSWNSIISGYCQNENHIEAMKLFREMQFRSVQADRTTLAVILSSCAGLELLEGGKQVHAVMQKGNFHNDIYVASGLIGLYSKCGKAEMAKCIFYGLPEKDVVCWNSLISGLSLSSLDMEAFLFFKQMREMGMLPTQFSYATILGCCAKLSSLSLGRQVYAQLLRDGYVNDVFVGSALIEMYCKCGDMKEAVQFFDAMPEKNTVTWNQIIHGFAQNGLGEEGVRLYREMIKLGVKPDDITFVAVLTACSHGGLVDDGIKIFNLMQLEHGVEPLVDHYTCIIDCLSRSGRFYEVESLLDRIPFKDDPVIWEVLLSSSRVHANVRVARRAAEELLRINPQNSAPYVLLANIYASLGQWDEVRAVRESMSQNQVAKDPGCSWLERDDLLAFNADDSSNCVVEVV